MTDKPKPRKGDRVRVVIEGTFEPSTVFAPGYIRANGHVYLCPPDSVEVLSPPEPPEVLILRRALVAHFGELVGEFDKEALDVILAAGDLSDAYSALLAERDQNR